MFQSLYHKTILSYIDDGHRFCLKANRVHVHAGGIVGDHVNVSCGKAAVLFADVKRVTVFRHEQQAIH